MWWYGSLSISMLKKLLGEIRDGRISVPQFHPSLIIINTVINGKSAYAMVDTGATTSLISKSELNTIPHSSIIPTATTATLGDGRTHEGTIRGVKKLYGSEYDSYVGHT